MAQDPFAIEVYGDDAVPRGAWTLGAHLNYTALGTTVYDGSLAPTQHQGHLAFELTHGVTEHWEVAGYLLSAVRPGTGIDYAGWRIRTRFRVSESGRLPVTAGVAAELGFYPAHYGENAVGLEIRPILVSRIGPVEVRFNPVVERGLRGRDASNAGGWEFDPSARVGVSVSHAVDLGVEYYGKTALLGSTVPGGEQVSQFYPAVDLTFGEDFVVNAGVGFRTTSAGDRLIFKSRFEIPLGR